MDGPPRATPLEFEQLRIIIAGTPKTGNTWLRHLLAQLYTLPTVDLDPNFFGNDFDGFGRRWVGQQHYYPEPAIVAEGAKRGIVFIAPIRHPGDVLVSLRHHIQQRGGSAAADDDRQRTMWPESMLKDGDNVFGPHTRRFVEDGFCLNLHLSICWLRGRWALGGRYEDLWRRPFETFKHLAERLVPMPDNALRHALCACEIGLMQQLDDPSGAFVRKGGLNSWRDVLPKDVRTLLATREPYPVQLAALGYTMDLADPANVREADPADAGNPFRRHVFANGVPVAAIHLRIYFNLPQNLIDQWADACAVGAGSFYAWLLQPAAADPARATAVPVITEMAHWLYQNRPDVQEAFPNPFGGDREQVADWFLFSACLEYGYDRRFAMPVVQSWAAGRPLTEIT